MKRLIGIVIAVTTIATPAFAQNYGTSISGNTVSTPSRPHSRTINRPASDPIYAMSPRANFYGRYPYNDNTGGGSPGYNEMLMNW